MSALGDPVRCDEHPPVAGMRPTPVPKPAGQRQKVRATGKGPVSQPISACGDRLLPGRLVTCVPKESAGEHRPPNIKISPIDRVTQASNGVLDIPGDLRSLAGFLRSRFAYSIHPK